MNVHCEVHTTWNYLALNQLFFFLVIVRQCLISTLEQFKSRHISVYLLFDLTKSFSKFSIESFFISFVLNHMC